MSDDGDRANELILEWESASQERRLELVQLMASALTNDSYHRFTDLLVSTLRPGILDVTSWNRLAVKAALIVCSERDISVTFKNGTRTLAPVTYPKEGPLLEMFVDAIMLGKWS